MLTAHNLHYIHPQKEVLFEKINFSLQKQDKVSLIGKNGSGKSTLLKIFAGITQPSQGDLFYNSKPYYIPQHFGQYNELTIAQALQISHKLNSLEEILKGNVSEKNLSILDDDWTIEEKALEALKYWDLQNLTFTQKLHYLSGGEKTKVFLAGLLIHKPEIVLLDEPTNHLDHKSRDRFYDYLQNDNKSMVVVSHDRTLLNMIYTVYELDKGTLLLYGGNYDFYINQKALEKESVDQSLKNKENELRKARKTNQESLERKLRLNARGAKKEEKAGTPKIMKGFFKNKADRTTSKLKEIHNEKIEEISEQLSKLRMESKENNKVKLDFHASVLHKGKILIKAQQINYKPGLKFLWKSPLNFQIKSGERIHIKGSNGSGKTTLIKLILGNLEPALGNISRSEMKALYIDQDYCTIDNSLSIFEQAQVYNTEPLQEHEVKIRLNRFLFHKELWDKPCGTLSGGEKMRLMLCCLMIGNNSPDLFILDEPTNNLDIQNIDILTSAINSYSGTLLVISHDKQFLQEINVERTIELE